MQWHPFQYCIIYHLSSGGAFVFADALENTVVRRFSLSSINR
jgi:hypothetical protein